jgi:hypothetical protein
VEAELMRVVLAVMSVRRVLEELARAVLSV